MAKDSTAIDIFHSRLAEMKDRSQNVKIQRVPYVRCDSATFHRYYEPRVVPIGPLHHDEAKFKLSEEFKIQLAARFIEENELNEEDLYHTINGQMAELTKCYNEEDIKIYRDYKLASIFVVDGCAVLHYMHCRYNENLEEISLKRYEVAFLQQDMFLLENQLPYQLLEAIMSRLTENRRKEMKKSIYGFINNIVGETRGYVVRTDPPCQQITHLLDLFWKQLLLRQPDHDASLSSSDRTKLKSDHDAYKLRESLWFSFRNVSELKAAGIQFVPKKEGSLEDVSFSSGWFTGSLTLPSIIIDDSTVPKFLNLIAYERCPDFHNKFEVSSYISFLDTLIDESNDVKELRKAKVLRNLLGSDEEVAKIFNEIGADLVPDQSTHFDVRKAIQIHYDNKWTTWIAEGLYTHFSSPWTIIAFFAAVLVLLLTVIQTAYSIISTNADLKEKIPK